MILVADVGVPRPEPQGQLSTRTVRLAPDSGARIVCAVIVASLLAALVLPALVNVAFPVVAFVVGLQLLRRGRVVAFWELVAWLYLIAPGLRRLVDWHAGFHLNSPVLVAAPLTALLGLVLLPYARPGRAVPALAHWLALLVVAYAVAVGLLLHSPTSVLVGALQWLGPLSLGLVLLLGQHDGDALREALHRLARWGLLVLGGYGVVQFFVLPPWDAAWMRAVQATLGTIGQPRPLEVRVFSLGNAPGPLAAALAVLLLLVICSRRSLLDDLAVTLGLATLGLSLVRASWIVFAAGLLLLVLVGRVSAVRVVVASLVLGTALLAVGGPLADVLVQRIDKTAASGGKDESLQARIAFQTTVLPRVLRSPVGQGLGSTGVAAERDQGGSGVANVDSGYLEVLFVLGAPLGMLTIVAVTAAGVSSWRRALRTRGSAAKWETALAATAVTVPVTLLFTNPLTASAGALLWTALAHAATSSATAPLHLDEVGGVGDAGPAGHS